MSAREIIRSAFVADSGGFGAEDDTRIADAIIEALHAAGYRILAPGDVDPETAEKCAETAHDCFKLLRESSNRLFDEGDQGSAILTKERAYGASDAAVAIRALAKEGGNG